MYIVAAVFVTMIGVGVVGSKAPIKATADLSFASGFLAITDIVSIKAHTRSPFADNLVDVCVCRYAFPAHCLSGPVAHTVSSGHAAFFTFISEMKNPNDFPKALAALQISDTTLYLLCGVVVYAYVGDEAVSPALGNTGPILRKVAYGIAMPTIIIAGVVNGHVCAKLVFVRM